MDSEIRIPPGVTVQFERIALEVCEVARLDFGEWWPRIHEYVGHLELLWLEGIEMGLSTEDAERRAIEIFGQPQVVGAALRGSWPTRFLFSERSRWQRYVVFLCGAVGCALLLATDLTTGAPNDQRMMKFTLVYSLLSLLGPAAVGALAVLRRPWEPGRHVFSKVFAWRWMLLPVALAGLGVVLGPAVILWPRDFLRLLSGQGQWSAWVLETPIVVFGLFGAIGYVSELVGLPSKGPTARHLALLRAGGG